MTRHTSGPIRAGRELAEHAAGPTGRGQELGHPAGRSAGSSQDLGRSPRRWWVLAALVLVVIVFDLNLTMINVALPTLASDLDASSAQLQWFSSSYSLAVAAALLPAGLLGDRYGAKRPLLIALVVLGITALACTQAATPGQLIAGQLMLGVSAGFLPALSLALVKITFDSQELTRALAVWSIGMTAGIPLGPMVGGYLTSEFGWAAIYVLNVPLVLVAVIMLAVLLPWQAGSERTRIDVPGALLSSGGIAALVYGFTLAGEAGWGSISVVLAVLLGAALVATFILWLRRASAPIVNPALFGSVPFRSGVILPTLVTFALMGGVFTIPLYFHMAYSADAVESGLRLMPIVAGLLIGVVLTGAIRKFVPLHMLIATGFAALGLGAMIGAITVSEGNFGVTASWLAIAGVGIGFAMPATIGLAMDAVPEAESGVGSGTLQAIRQVGGTFGIAILGSLLAGVYRGRVDLSGLDEDDAAAAGRAPTSGLDVAVSEADPGLAESVRSAFMAGMQTTLWASVAIALIGMVLALLLARPRASSNRR